MKKSFFLAVAAVAMTACSNDVDLGLKDANKQTSDNAIGFEVRNSNMSRAPQELELQKTGHYNFGVFGYKDAPSNPAIMVNYLVGYMDRTNFRGYYMTTGNQTTNGDDQGTDNGKSMWSYEKLGYEDYTYTESEGYYKKDNTEYMSNFKNQFLRYWDYSSASTNFYAYAPYIHGSGTGDPLKKGVVTFDNNTHKMNFPAGTIKAGYDDPSKYEYLYAATKVNNIEYGKDVALTFKHINSKIMITFWEDIAGYSVQMIDLVSGQTGVSAAPAKIVSNNAYKYGTLVKSAGAVLEFTGSDNFDNPTVTAATFNYRVPYKGVDAPTAVSDNEFLKFETPEATTLAVNRQEAVTGSYPTNKNFSKTVYYAIPKDNASGLTFHCSFILTNEQTHETIKVQDARVHVKAANCVWEAGKRYIYVFKITKDATGTTGNPEPIIPGDPRPGEPALYPIVFDNIKVEDWTDAFSPANGGNHDIN